MREREIIARAIFDDDHEWDRRPPHMHEHWLNKADAIIAALSTSGLHIVGKAQEKGDSVCFRDQWADDALCRVCQIIERCDDPASIGPTQSHLIAEAAATACCLDWIDAATSRAIMDVASAGQPLEAAMMFVPDDWWWHASHLEVSVIPTSAGLGALANVVSNARHYDHRGRPERFTSAVMACHYKRSALPLGFVSAALKAFFAVRVSISEALWNEAKDLLIDVRKPSLKPGAPAETRDEIFSPGFELQHRHHWVRNALLLKHEPEKQLNPTAPNSIEGGKIAMESR